MAFPVILAKAVSTVVTGAVGVAAYNGAKKLYDETPVRSAAVAVTAAGLKGVRRVEEGAESARLAVSDVVAEAKERNGEQATPPAADAGHGHDHDH